jgi:hypothetical protein
MLKVLPTICFGLILGSSAMAEEYVLPATDPIASVTFPDEWKSSIYAKGVESISGDNQVYFAVEATDSSRVEASITEALEYLQTKGVNVDESSLQKDSTDIGGKQTATFDWDGKDKNGACKVGLALMRVKGNKGLLFIYYATPEGSKAHLQELSAILASVKPQ